MDDWRLISNGEELWKDVRFFKIVFPEFWEESVCEKNTFYQMVVEDAEQFVKEQIGRAHV